MRAGLTHGLVGRDGRWLIGFGGRNKEKKDIKRKKKVAQWEPVGVSGARQGWWKPNGSLATVVK